jgi:hypothetical protein
MQNNNIQSKENCLRCSRKRKRNDYENNYRKRKFEEDLDDIIINKLMTKFQKIDIINDIKSINNKSINNKSINIKSINKKRLYDDTFDININDINIININDINIKLCKKKQKINETYNCTLHDDTKEICLVYNCLGNINVNDNIVYNYIK